VADRGSKEIAASKTAGARVHRISLMRQNPFKLDWRSNWSPAETVFIAPEVFLGPFKSPISDGTRVALGVSFNVLGDAVHAQTYTVTAAFDIPNPYGY